MTVVELREELEARELPTSGHKDELIARLEEDDADEAAMETPGDAEVQAQADFSDNPDPWKQKYHPMELPANTVAAQAYADMHPDAVDETMTFSEERTAQASAHIQAYGSTEDPRLTGASLVTVPELAQAEEEEE